MLSIPLVDKNEVMGPPLWSKFNTTSWFRLHDNRKADDQRNIFDPQELPLLVNTVICHDIALLKSWQKERSSDIQTFVFFFRALKK